MGVVTGVSDQDGVRKGYTSVETRRGRGRHYTLNRELREFQEVTFGSHKEVDLNGH